MHVVELEAYCKPPREPRLVFWNTLDSEEDVQYSNLLSALLDLNFSEL